MSQVTSFTLQFHTFGIPINANGPFLLKLCRIIDSTILVLRDYGLHGHVRQSSTKIVARLRVKVDVESW